jgi:hypothetical protein
MKKAQTYFGGDADQIWSNFVSHHFIYRSQTGCTWMRGEE